MKLSKTLLSCRKKKIASEALPLAQSTKNDYLFYFPMSIFALHVLISLYKITVFCFSQFRKKGMA
jgi:hypothetical protein